MKISVAVCTYNGKEYIEAQLKSIITQTKAVDEIVLVDDHSTDHTLEVAEKYLHKQKVNFRLIRNDVNLGVTKNFEKAIGLCKGDIILTSDQDDLWQVDKVEKIMKQLENEKTMLVFTNAQLIDGNSKKMNKKLWDNLEIKPDQSRLFEDLCKVSMVTGATMGFRKSLYEQAIPFNPLWVHDEWLAIHAINMGEVVALDECLIKYRIHANNVIGVVDQSKQGKKERFNDNLSKAKELRELKYQRYLAVQQSLEGKKVNANFTKFKQVVEFWKNLSSNPGKMTYLKELVKGEYHKYSSGFPAFIRDFSSK